MFVVLLTYHFLCLFRQSIGPGSWRIHLGGLRVDSPNAATRYTNSTKLDQGQVYIKESFIQRLDKPLIGKINTHSIKSEDQLWNV